LGLTRKVGQRDCDLDPRRDAHLLAGCPERSAQGFVAGDHAIDRALEGALIEQALEPEGDGLIVRAGGVIAPLGGEPNLQLAFAQRGGLRFLRCLKTRGREARRRGPLGRKDAEFAHLGQAVREGRDGGLDMASECAAGGGKQESLDVIRAGGDGETADGRGMLSNRSK
jgi:hypothetical protein